MGETDTKPLAADGGDMLKIMLDLVGKVSSLMTLSETIQRDLREMRVSNETRTADLQERVGKTEALNQVQDERLKSCEALKARIEDMQKRMWIAYGIGVALLTALNFIAPAILPSIQIVR